ncbi:universal stress protein [Nocardioides aquiterrae]|uniref:Universal stress protein n=1 Tax=Nocardioides aquiterrae TaxID=203799 RepID=A0ABN1UP72_9ACTN
MDTRPSAVVVAVGGRGSSAAIEYAANEALRRHAALHLVHALPEGDEGIDQGTEILAAAVRLATALLDGLAPVTASLVPGRAVEVVAEAAGRADLVVVGRCAESQRTHPYVRSVTGGVGARVEVPVVSVPDGWQPRVGPPTVVVGIDDPGESTDVLAAALRAAKERRARLVVVSTWWRPPVTKVSETGWQAVLEEGLDLALDAVGARASGVPVEVQVRQARPAETLIAASWNADLVVLGRHATVVPAGSHLGPVARSVLRESCCPVLLTTPRDPHLHEAARRKLFIVS